VRGIGVMPEGGEQRGTKTLAVRGSRGLLRVGDEIIKEILDWTLVHQNSPKNLGTARAQSVLLCIPEKLCTRGDAIECWGTGRVRD
jgi:hypothetical protein